MDPIDSKGKVLRRKVEVGQRTPVPVGGLGVGGRSECQGIRPGRVSGGGLVRVNPLDPGVRVGTKRIRERKVSAHVG